MSKRTARILIGIVLLGVILIMTATPSLVNAQDPTPTPYPIINYVDIDGNILALESTVTFGDIALVVVGLFIGTVLSLQFIYQFVVDWLK